MTEDRDWSDAVLEGHAVNPSCSVLHCLSYYLRAAGIRPKSRVLAQAIGIPNRQADRAQEVGDPVPMSLRRYFEGHFRWDDHV